MQSEPTLLPADWARLSYDLLEKVASRKPPGTIVGVALTAEGPRRPSRLHIWCLRASARTSAAARASGMRNP